MKGSPQIRSPSFTILGTGQDGGTPQAGCSCPNCIAAHSEKQLARYPVAAGVSTGHGEHILLEASRALPHQLMIWGDKQGLDCPIIPTHLALTHVHLGHIEGIGQFGKEAMGVKNVKLIASDKVLSFLSKRGNISPFKPLPFDNKIHTTGFTSELVDIEFIRVPHRDENSDTHAILVSGKKNRILFIPDHDDWKGTLALHNFDNIRDWFRSIEISHAFIDATFWDANELQGRDMSEVPHPTVTETLEMLGERKDEDPEIHLFHLNHTNPLNNPSSDERATIEQMGWNVAERGWTIEL